MMGGPVMVIFEKEKVTLSAPCPIEKAPLILALIIIIIIIYIFLERHILKALWRFTILKINKKLQKTIKSLFKKKGLKAPFECV